MQHACCKHISGLYNLPFSMTINDLFQKPIISFYTFHMPIKFYSKLIVNGILTHSTLEYWHLKHRNMIAIEQKITHFSRCYMNRIWYEIDGNRMSFCQNEILFIGDLRFFCEEKNLFFLKKPRLMKHPIFILVLLMILCYYRDFLCKSNQFIE